MGRYYLLGEHLSHSLSPEIHALIGNPDYCLLELAPDELSEFFEKKNFDGINVTVPYKEKVIPFLDEISEGAKEIGSVNTVVNKGGKLIGYNTDIDGFLYMLESADISLGGKKVVILGSGGTSKTAAFAAKTSGAANITVISRSGENNYQTLYSLHRDAEIIINTTPVGMYPNSDAKPIDLKYFERLSGVVDVIYNPYRTELILDAADLGIRHTGGLPMLVSQACRAHEIFFGTEVDEKKKLDTLLSVKNKLRNIILIGMPGVGKTTVGQMLASLTGMGFIDCDKEIERIDSRPIPRIFAESGEEFFRSLEAEVVRNVSGEKGKVIACGGGAVLSKENRHALRRSGLVILLERPLENLSRHGRPLSSGIDALKDMFEKRKGLYLECSDIKVNLPEDPSGNISELRKMLDGEIKL